LQFRQDEVEALVPKAEEAMGTILVANAGITKDNLMVQLRDEDWDQVGRQSDLATFCWRGRPSAE
jgi:3-oxoacyl-[acyl-carrier protein] reductase